MPKDKFTATWVSHSSISDFLSCPRAYFLSNVYKNPKTGHKIRLISPPLSLGIAVHNTIESLSILKTDERFRQSPLERFESEWRKLSGIRGGFFDAETEQTYKKRGIEMIRRVIDHPGPLKNLAVKIKQNLPYFWLSEEENIILCGRIDWLEFNPEDKTVHIIDFKTGKQDEHPNSLQLPIYYLIATNCQTHPVSKVSYWYINRNNEPIEQKLPDSQKSEQKILKIAKEIKLARKLNRFACPAKNGCRSCRDMETIVHGEATYVGTDEMNYDIFVLKHEYNDSDAKSEIL